MVLGDDGPTIRQLTYGCFACINHRLNRKNHASLELEPSPNASIVKYLRLLMKLCTDTMTAEFFDYAAPFAFGKALDGMADIAQIFAGFDFINATPHRFVRNLT